MADSALAYILKTRITQMGKEALEDLFGPDGLLGSFGAKIKMAYTFRVVDLKLRNDLDRIREIRNTFAHAWIHIDFDTPAIKRACDGFNFRIPKYFETLSNAKNKYLHACFTITEIAAAQMRHADLGHIRKLKETIALEKVEALREKSLQRFLQQIQLDPRSLSRAIGGASPPASSRA